MKFNRAKCKFLHLGQDNLEYQCRLGNKGFENHPVQKNLGIPVDRNSKKSTCSPRSQL